MLRNIFLFLLALGIYSASYSQVAINHSGDPPAECAMLDINSTQGGLLIPRVSLTALDDQTPVEGEMIDGLIVFNTETTGELRAGIYIWYDNAWQRFNIGNQAFTQGVPTTSHDVTSSMNYFDAYAYCRNLEEGGYTDWRLPSLTEAEILDNAGDFGDMSYFVWTTTAAGEGTGTGRKNMLYKPSTDERKLLEISGSHKFRCVR